MTRRIAGSIGLLLSISAHAGSLVSPMPAGRIFPDPVGILFPGFNVAAGVNPAALPMTGKGAAVQVAGTMGTQSGDPTEIFGSLAVSRGSFGFGGGYRGVDAGGTRVNGAFGGIAYNFEPVSLGLGARDFDISRGDASLDFGMILQTKTEIVLGAVLYDINHATQADIGIGTAGGKRYNLEANVLLPPFNALSGGGYLLTASASVFPGSVGLHFRASYQTATKDVSYTVAGGAQLSENIYLLLQYATTRRATAAVTVMF